jgi:Xylose isomerase-like TIM barrel
MSDGYGGEVSATVEPRPVEQDGLARHHPLGISTGVFAELRSSWPRLVAEACAVSTYAVELSALSESELPGLISYLGSKPRLPFSYVSVHAPVKGLGADEASTAQTLERLPLFVRSIVTHPDALRDVGPYRSLATRLVLENMDDRKHTGRTAGELAAMFDELPQAGFCFDIAHAHAVDPSLSVAQELLDAYRSRLRQVHVSSLRRGSHVPLTDTDEELFSPILARCRDVPWILEARPPRRWASEVKGTALVDLAATS